MNAIIGYLLIGPPKGRKREGSASQHRRADDHRPLLHLTDVNKGEGGRKKSRTGRSGNKLLLIQKKVK